MAESPDLSSPSPSAASDRKVTGPASYFPSIEKKYGRPIEYWLDLAASRPDATHMELVDWLKAEHGLGHGHANAVVHVARQDHKR